MYKALLVGTTPSGKADVEAYAKYLIKTGLKPDEIKKCVIEEKGSK